MIDDRQPSQGGNVRAPRLGVTAIPSGWTYDTRIDDGAYRLLVLLHDPSLPERVEDRDLADLLGCSTVALRSRYRDLAHAGYLVQRVDGHWEVVPWQ